MNLAKGINKESQVVVRIATNVAGECTDSIMEKVGWLLRIDACTVHAMTFMYTYI